MDTETLSAPEMRDTLTFLRLTNRRFGGEAVVLRHLERWSRRWSTSETIRVLDVGTGAADIPVAVARWARKRGFRLHITALDLTPEVIAIARENARPYPEIEVLQENIFALSLDKPFDYVTASLFLHHCGEEDSRRALTAFDKLATRGVIVSDLVRSPASYGAVTLLSYLAGNRVVRHDGPLSVRRAFLPEELARLAWGLGLNYLTDQREPWFRVSLAGEK